MFQDENFRVIYETKKYILGNMWEETYLYNKVNKTEIFLCSFYGDCATGLISDEDDWCIAGGDIIAIWKKGELTIIENEQLMWVRDIRIKEKNIIEILIDPWSENSAIWELDLKNLQYKKIADFNIYKNEPYTDKVQW